MYSLLFFIILIACGIFIHRRLKHRVEAENATSVETQSDSPSPPVPYTDSGEIIHISMLQPDDFIKNYASEYIAFDFETTGLSPNSDEIIEIGAAKVLNGKVIDTLSTFVNPCRHIPEAASAVNHITDQMVSDAPLLADAISRFVSFASGLPCVAHNAVFDVRFLLAGCEKVDVIPSLHYADSLKIAKKYLPGLDNYKLTTVANHINHGINEAHRALDDSLAVAAIISECVERHDAIEKNEAAYARHTELIRIIESNYTRAYNEKDYYSPFCAKALNACFEDIELLDTVKGYCIVKGWPIPRGEAYKRAAMILSKRNEFDKAIAICKTAIDHGFTDDGSSGGMAMRILSLSNRKARQEEIEQKSIAKQGKISKKKADEEAITRASTSSTQKRAVIQYSYDGSEIIREYESVSEAVKVTGINAKSIRDAAMGRQKHAGSFSWKYAQRIEEKEGAV